MNEFKESLLILYSTPLYAILIGLEVLMTHIHNKHHYSVKGTLENIYLSFLNMGLDILLRGVCLFVLDWFFRFHKIEIHQQFWYWFLLFLGQDFLFYILHCVDHYVRLFWAVHVTHHSSEEFNLTVGFRSSVFQPLYRFIYFIPLALAGFKGMDIMFMYSLMQIYGILIHTQLINKLGVLEWVLATPSHHRVHHGSNLEYIDKNMGMALIIWDRLFGTFAEENVPVKYGLTENIKSHHPKEVLFHEWIKIAADIRKAPTFIDKFQYLFGRPGWKHTDCKETTTTYKTEEATQLSTINN